MDGGIFVVLHVVDFMISIMEEAVQQLSIFKTVLKLTWIDFLKLETY